MVKCDRPNLFSGPMPVPRINQNGLSFHQNDGTRRRVQRRYTNNTTSVRRQTIDSEGLLEGQKEMTTPGIGFYDEDSQIFFPILPDISSMASDAEQHSPRPQPQG